MSKFDISVWGHHYTQSRAGINQHNALVDKEFFKTFHEGYRGGISGIRIFHEIEFADVSTKEFSIEALQLRTQEDRQRPRRRIHKIQYK